MPKPEMGVNFPHLTAGSVNNAPMITLQIHHISLTVTDLARARSFYEGVLGLKPNPQRPVKAFDGVWYDLGAQQIHLIVIQSEKTGYPAPAYGGMDRHTALTVSHLALIQTRLEKGGIPYEPSRSGRPVVFCRDPDGNGFELIGAAP